MNRRQESSSKPARTETTVIFLPDIWSVMPTSNEHVEAKTLYEKALDAKINPPQPKPEPEEEKPEVKEESKETVAEPVTEGTDKAETVKTETADDIKDEPVKDEKPEAKEDVADEEAEDQEPEADGNEVDFKIFPVDPDIFEKKKGILYQKFENCKIVKLLIKAMMGKKDFRHKLSIFLANWPPSGGLNDLKKHCIKNLIIHF